MEYGNYIYAPVIRTRASELQGIAKLREETKVKLLPRVDLAKLGQNHSVNNSLDKWLSSFSGPAILNLAPYEKLRVSEYDDLVDSSNNFRQWISFVEKSKCANESLIPSIIYNNKVTKREFVKQVHELESQFKKIVLTVDPRKERDIQAALEAATVVNEIDNLLIILDCGQINPSRQMLALESTLDAINRLRSIDTSVEIVTASTSFPKSFAPFCSDIAGEKGIIPMLEWDNYHTLGGQDVAIYGDYASVHGEFYESRGVFVARVDYPTPSEWIFERRRKLTDDKTGKELYQLAAQEIINNEVWDDDLDLWSTDIIRKVSRGEIEKFASPSKWISVRVNLHIERIVDFLESGITPVIQEDEEVDW